MTLTRPTPVNRIVVFKLSVESQWRMKWKDVVKRKKDLILTEKHCGERDPKEVQRFWK